MREVRRDHDNLVMLLGQLKLAPVADWSSTLLRVPVACEFCLQNSQLLMAVIEGLSTGGYVHVYIIIFFFNVETNNYFLDYSYNSFQYSPGACTVVGICQNKARAWKEHDIIS